MLGIVPDTQTLMTDTAVGPYPQLTARAVERAKSRLGITDLEELASALGFSRQSFWRVRRGEYDIRLSHALTIANRIGLPLHKVFQGGPHA
jgi:DNA-binding XRE family transcriptional regulator